MFTLKERKASVLRSVFVFFLSMSDVWSLMNHGKFHEGITAIERGFPTVIVYN